MARRIDLDKLDREQLLDTPLCQLPVTLRDSLLYPVLDTLDRNLTARGITAFRPHCWLSSEWFSPDGVPGIAWPFYLAHRRLIRLEKYHMFEAEGSTRTDCLRILRHEMGHCIDTAYRLHRRQGWRDVFGKFSEPYPDYYKPDPTSRDHVTHLRAWYAQSHPAEDFAETFAVWLTGEKKWRQQYTGWPALRKLEYVDQLMKEIGHTKPAVRSRRQVEPIKQLNLTLREHYRRKRLHYANEWPEFYDRDLRQLFSDDPRFGRRPTAASFLRKIRPELRQAVAKWTGAYPYTVDQVLLDMIDRCKELNLRLAVPTSQAKSEAKLMVAVQTNTFMLTGADAFPM